MATLFFSGIEKSDTARILSSVSGSAGMISFLQYSRHLFDVCEAYGLQIAFDSGAFGKVLTMKDIERYARVICELGDRCVFYANADVIGDQKQSNENYQFLLSLLPPDLHHKVLWVYQVSAPLRYLDEGLERFERIGVGGLVSLLAQDRNGPQLLTVAQRIAEQKIEPHYFGLGQLRWLRLLCDLHEGRFTCDSSTWLIGSKFDLLIRSDGRQVSAKKTGFDFASTEVLTQNVRTMKKWVETQDSLVKQAPALQMSLFG